MTLGETVVLFVVSLIGFAWFTYIRLNRGLELPVWLALGWFISLVTLLSSWFYLLGLLKPYYTIHG
ncbi:MAG TPA: hypothetical protein VGK02_02850 [Candidatus Aquicultor sp.]|jgi:predicted ABC-type exoprotein transport system permease subunit